MYSTSYSSSSGYLSVIAIIAFIAALVAAILMFVFILPEKKKDGLGKFGLILHDIFNFKSLLIEKILKFCYIFSTVYIIVFGFFKIFDFGGYTYTGWEGLLMLLFGPIVIRLAYEFLMLIIMLVKNVIDIRNKLVDDSNDSKVDPDAQSGAQNYSNAQPNIEFCAYCGVQYDRNQGGCPNPGCPSNM